ncbi:uncharacterized protein LOC107324383 [Coturnix japonica]|uniref:Uncharacterized LOC107324383 n=1 Tax=Coturnix japonica TaxID=93934 RepID=A0A8C2TTS7_COTJA|nr:uncharacterized protein LOC107324383 [Coturnix japonica]
MQNRMDRGKSSPSSHPSLPLRSAPISWWTRNQQSHSDMSKLIKAITDMMDGSARRGKKSESFSRSEFKKLIQQEFAPVKRSSTSKYHYIGSTLDSDTEPMNKKEKGSSKTCVY